MLQESYLVSPSSPEMDPDEFEKRAETIFKEYFDHGDVQEVAASLDEFNIRNIKHEVSYLAFEIILYIIDSLCLFSLSLFLPLPLDCPCANHYCP